MGKEHRRISDLRLDLAFLHFLLQQRNNTKTRDERDREKEHHSLHSLSVLSKSIILLFTMKIQQQSNRRRMNRQRGVTVARWTTVMILQGWLMCDDGPTLSSVSAFSPSPLLPPASSSLSSFKHRLPPSRLYSEYSYSNDGPAATTSSTASTPSWQDPNVATTPATAPLVYECLAPDDSALSRLKRDLLQLAASYDRGFGATPRSRAQVMTIIESLEAQQAEDSLTRYSSTTTNNRFQSSTTTLKRRKDTLDAARGADGLSLSPLQGIWRMLWTTALDVVSLNASPFFTVGAIHQVFTPPVVTNVIDFAPRLQSLFSFNNNNSDTWIRAQVRTRASRRTANRVGLVFEQVQLQPKQVLGFELDVFPPLQFNLPRLPDSFTGSNVDSPGFFDVTYLDEDLLIIRENAPGGLFVLLKVDSIDA
jgi:hypothetical protein